MTEKAPSRAFDPVQLQDCFGAKGDPYPVLAEARRRGAILPGSPELGLAPAEILNWDGAPIFTIYSHELASEVLRDNKTFSSSILARGTGIFTGRSMIEMDEPEHQDHRRLVAHAFRPKALARWETELMEHKASEMVEALAVSRAADLVAQFTFVFPVRIIAGILGLPKDDYEMFQRLSAGMLGVLVDIEGALTAMRALTEYFAAILEERRARPQDDLVSELSQVEIDGRRLSDEEIFGFLRLLLPAGVETTYRSSGNLLFALLTHADQLEALRDDRSLMGAAIEEGLRWQTPVMHTIRQATQSTALADVQIPEGAVLQVCIGAANRDEARYVDPDRFDIRREAKPHLAFGFGAHICLGNHLARVETRIALNALLDRFPRLSLDTDMEPPEIQGAAFRSPNALHVRW